MRQLSSLKFYWREIPFSGREGKITSIPTKSKIFEKETTFYLIEPNKIVLLYLVLEWSVKLILSQKWSKLHKEK